jgi:hypothetical protein
METTLIIKRLAMVALASSIVSFLLFDFSFLDAHGTLAGPLAKTKRLSYYIYANMRKGQLPLSADILKIGSYASLVYGYCQYYFL